MDLQLRYIVLYVYICVLYTEKVPYYFFCTDEARHTIIDLKMV